MSRNPDIRNSVRSRLGKARSLSQIKVLLFCAPYRGYMSAVNLKTSLVDTPDAPARGRDLGALIAAEVPRLRRHAISLVYSRADAEDLVQDCIETALVKQA